MRNCKEYAQRMSSDNTQNINQYIKEDDAWVDLHRN